MRNIHAFERSIPAEEARRQIATVVNELEYQRKIRFHHYVKNGIDVVYVEDASGKEITYGLGKGTESDLGAYGECLEHLLYHDLGRENTTKVSLEELKQAVDDDPILRYAYRLPGAEHELDCMSFNFVGSDDNLLIPRIYINYHYLDEKFLDEKTPQNLFQIFISRYVTTSGTAFGLTASDAYLHALNEIVERDVTSEFLLELTQDDFALKHRFVSLDLTTLTGPLSQVLKRMRILFTPRDIAIYISHTLFGTWWSLCVMYFDDNSNFILPQWGAGCSLLYDLAIDRSLNECIQMASTYEIENVKENEKLLNFVKHYPRLRPIADLIPMRAYPSELYNPDLNINVVDTSEQIQQITATMIDNDFRPTRYVTPVGTQGWLACAYIANLERFYNVTKSVHVLPLQHIEDHA